MLYQNVKTSLCDDADTSLFSTAKRDIVESISWKASYRFSSGRSP